MTGVLKAPFPWFGGKSRVAHLVWDRFGDVRNYVEPFFGSGAVLLARPMPFDGPETINDKDGFVANFWRAIQHAPSEVAKWADHPVNENDLHARNVWLRGIRPDFQAKVEGDPHFFDAKVAGWWVWGMCAAIGHSFSAKGPWGVVDGKLTKVGDGQGVTRAIVHLGGRQGVQRQIVNIGDDGQDLCAWFDSLANRLRRVRVTSGDWARVCTPAVTSAQAPCGVFLDPPYSDQADRDSNVYASDDLSVAHDVRDWAIEHGRDPRYRIALCGYDGEHQMPDDWHVVEWKASGGYSRSGKGQTRGKVNCHRERIWFSPHCRPPTQASLF